MIIGVKSYWKICLAFETKLNQPEMRNYCKWIVVSSLLF